MHAEKSVKSNIYFFKLKSKTDISDLSVIFGSVKTILDLKEYSLLCLKG